VRDRHVDLSATAPGAWLSTREREVLVEGVPEQERNDVDYGVPVLRLLTARYGGEITVDAADDATTVRVLLPRAERSASGSDTQGIASGTLWRTLGIGLAAGVVMSLWLNDVGVSTPVPNLNAASLAGHLLWGGLVGVLSATLPPLPDRRSVRNRMSAAIGR